MLLSDAFAVPVIPLAHLFYWKWMNERCGELALLGIDLRAFEPPAQDSVRLYSRVGMFSAAWVSYSCRDRTAVAKQRFDELKIHTPANIEFCL